MQQQKEKTQEQTVWQHAVENAINGTLDAIDLAKNFWPDFISSFKKR